MTGMQGLFLFCCCLFLLLTILLTENWARRAEVKRLIEAERENVRALQKQHEINLILSDLTGSGGREVYLWWLKNRGEDFVDCATSAPAPSSSGGSTPEPKEET